MRQPVWTYYFARKFSASRFEIVMRVFFSDFYRRHFGAHLKNNLVKPEAGNHAIYFIAPEWEHFARQVYRASCRDWQTFRRYVRMIKRAQTRSLRIAKGIARKRLRRLSWQQLGRLWEAWDRAHLDHFLKPIWIPFIIEPLLSEDVGVLLVKLAARRRLSEHLAEYIGTVFGPDHPNAITEERKSILRIALAIKRGSLRGATRDAALRRHAARFGFIPCYDVIDELWDQHHFQRELRELLRVSIGQLMIEHRDLTTRFSVRQREFRQLLRTLQPAPRERVALSMAHELAFIKDERDDYRRRQSAAIRPLFAELARRAHVPERAPLYLIRREMVEWFATGRLPVRNGELLARMHGYCLVRQDDSPVKVYAGAAMRRFLQTQRFAGTSAATGTVRGYVGNGGDARGPARIVRTKHDLRRVRRGDILVAVTTNPDFVPAMRKCKGFVTDEGGITSHAAIVAREWGVPCVVGAKNATSVFRDGQEVVVDGRTGTVSVV